MRALILLAIVVLVLALIGWVTFGGGPGRATINLETDKIRQDTEQVLEKGAETLHNAKDELRAADDTPPPAERTSEPAGSRTY